MLEFTTILDCRFFLIHLEVKKAFTSRWVCDSSDHIHHSVDFADEGINSIRAWIADRAEWDGCDANVPGKATSAYSAIFHDFRVKPALPRIWPCMLYSDYRTSGMDVVANVHNHNHEKFHMLGITSCVSDICFTRVDSFRTVFEWMFLIEKLGIFYGMKAGVERHNGYTWLLGWAMQWHGLGPSISIPD
jgi:hypothetical protein